MAKKTENFVLVKWNEWPPKWDIFPMKQLRLDLVGETCVSVGKMVHAPWANGFAEAVVRAIGM